MKVIDRRSFLMLSVLTILNFQTPAHAEDRAKARELYSKASSAYKTIPLFPSHPETAYIVVRKDLEESFSNWENSKTAYFLAVVCMKSTDFDSMKIHAQKSIDLKPDLSTEQKRTASDMLSIVASPAMATVIGTGAGPSAGTVGKAQFKPLLKFSAPSKSLD